VGRWMVGQMNMYMDRQIVWLVVSRGYSRNSGSVKERGGCYISTHLQLNTQSNNIISSTHNKSSTKSNHQISSQPIFNPNLQSQPSNREVRHIKQIYIRQEDKIWPKVRDGVYHGRNGEKDDKHRRKMVILSSE
jgi:hypothetical protein